MKLLCLGVGDAFSNRWYSSCVAVETQGFWLLVDCPHPIRKILREGSSHVVPGGLDLDRIDAVALTHRHADHVSGLEGLAFYNVHVLKKRTVLVTHPLVRADLWDHYLAATLNADGTRSTATYFDDRALSEKKPLSLGPLKIECRRTAHSVPTFALRISDGDRTLGLSSDTSFDPSLIEWLADSDLMVHETNVSPHTPYESLAALPDTIRSRMRLYHYPDDFDCAGSVIEPLVPGRLYQV